MSNPNERPVTRYSGEDPKAGQAAPVVSDLDEHLHGFWKKNSNAILVFCGLVLVGYLAKAGWEYFSREHREGIAQEYSAAITSEGWQAFADAHPDNVLAGVMEVRLGDSAYASGRLEAAITAYGKALDTLRNDPLASRARLGLAMAEVQAGRMTDGESLLHRLAESPAQPRSIRTEATYQLASLAAAAGLYADVKKFSAQLLQIDPNSPWTQRAFSLQTAAPPPASSAAPPASPPPGISFKPGAAK